MIDPMQIPKLRTRKAYHSQKKKKQHSTSTRRLLHIGHNAPQILQTPQIIPRKRIRALIRRQDEIRRERLLFFARNDAQHARNVVLDLRRRGPVGADGGLRGVEARSGDEAHAQRDGIDGGRQSGLARVRAVDPARGCGLDGADALRRQQVLGRAVHAHAAHHVLHAAVALEIADRGLDCAEAGVGAAERHVASHEEFVARARRRAVDFGDEDAGELCDQRVRGQGLGEDGRGGGVVELVCRAQQVHVVRPDPVVWDVAREDDDLGPGYVGGAVGVGLLWLDSL